MARFDKYDPKDGGFRAALGFAVVAADVGKVIPVDIDGSGLAQRAAANSANVRGVICPTEATAQGRPIDVMTDGEVVDVTTGDVTGAAAGATVHAGAAGTADVAGTGRTLGFFVEAWRLVVRVGRGA